MSILSADLNVLTSLAVAVVLGGLIGLERLFAGKTATMRTYGLVSMGSALFAIIALQGGRIFLDNGFASANPLHVISQIVTGVGFLGTGLIIFKDSKLQGLTSASGLWVSAGIGITSGLGLYSTAIAATVLTLFVFVGVYFIESWIRKAAGREEDNDHTI